MRGKIALVILSGLALVVGGCTESSDVGAAIQYAAPATHGATEVSHTIPATMAPGERRRVQVVMQNTGASSPTDDWATNTHRLITRGDFFGWSSTFVSTATATGQPATIEFTIQAPATPGSYTFSARMFNDGYFGDTLSVAVTVDAAEQPMWSCTFDPGSSSIPSTLTPGENASVTIAVTNSGTADWPSSGFYLYSRDNPLALWANGNSPLTATVASGATASFSFGITAPTTPGTYSLRRQILDATSGGIGFFASSPCVDVSIAVSSAPTLDASLAAEDFATTLAPGDYQKVTVSMQNDGTESWAADGNYVLFTQNSPAGLWNDASGSVTSVTASGGTATVTLDITAPTTPGTYEQRWRMRKLSGTGAGFFGDVVSVAVTVDGAATPTLDAEVVAQNIPSRMSAGKPATFEITMRNAGTADWDSTNFLLYTKNAPLGLWATAGTGLGSGETVIPGDTRTFSFTVVAPSSAGSYDSVWQMRESTTVFFGDQALTSAVEVTLCGNGAVDSGESCDDGNLVSGDGCSDTCGEEATDLASTTADREFVGSNNFRLLGSNAIGDLSGDGIGDLVLGEAHIPSNIGIAYRAYAGTIHGHLGAGAFFDGSTTTADTDSAFTIIGAQPNDFLAQYGTSGLIIADVTADGVGDLIVSARGGDGVDDLRTDCGEAFIIEGGSALASAGLVDLAADPLPSLVTTRFIGKNAGDELILLAVGELTGDSLTDLVFGAPRSDVGGTDAGAIYVVKRPAGGFPSVVDLAAPGTVAVYEIVGPAAGAYLGYTGGVANIGDSSTGDLVVGANDYDPSGRQNAGGAWAIFGPVAGDVDLAAAVGSGSGPDVAWYGRRLYERLGKNVELGDVTGTNVADVLISSANWEINGSTQVGAVLIFEGPIAGGTYDLSSGATPDTAVFGVDQSDGTGSAMAVGDTDGDGYDDLLVCAGAGDGPANGRASSGEGLLLSGAYSMPASIDLSTYASVYRFYGAADGDIMGYYRNSASLGDLDGDGRLDLCVGATAAGDVLGLTSAGQVYCFQR